jgi:hypothetical protein
MRRLWVCLGVVGCLIWSTPSAATAASAGNHGGAGSSSKSFPSGCKRVAYTADGGYFSLGSFYWEPGDTVTLVTKWCYSNGVITSHSVRYSTTIPTSLQPRLLTSQVLVQGRAVLDVQLNGDYDSGVLNNVGFIGIAGDVTRRGNHHFVNASGSGG